MEDLKQAIKLAAKLREDSYNEEMHKYVKTLRQCADEAVAEIYGFDSQATTPIYLLLSYAWDDILEWIEDIDGQYIIMKD